MMILTTGLETTSHTEVDYGRESPNDSSGNGTNVVREHQGMLVHLLTNEKDRKSIRGKRLVFGNVSEEPSILMHVKE